jgi:rSAM/selenodomain-associated transferase 1
VFVTPDVGADEMREIPPRELPVVGQGLGDLGARMRRAIEHLIVNRKGEIAILIGSDVPLLTAAHVDEAGAALRRGTDLVLGPADDGGYYLCGMTRVIDDMFDGIDWGTDRVLSQTIAAANRAGIRVQTIANLYDIDTIEDLRRAEFDLRERAPSMCRALRRFFATDALA